MRSLILLCCFFWYTTAVPNNCCPDNAVIKKWRCSNNASLWIADGCPLDAYVIKNDEYTINDDDTMSMTPDGAIVEKNEYCMANMDDVQMAMVCFKEYDSTSISSVGILICSIISIISVLLTLIVYFIVPNLRDLQGKCIMFTIFSLMISFIILAALQFSFDVEGGSCAALGFMLYFWFMATFFWLNILSFNVWRSVVRPKLLASKTHLFALYNVYGWGAPMLLLAILLICHHSNGNHMKPRFGESKCWFHEIEAQKAYFYGPICALLILNIIMFISTAWKLSKQTKNVTERKYRSHKYKMYLYLKLFIVMGICWIFEPLSAFLENQGQYLWMVTDYINTLQGLIIFLLLVVFRKRVRRDLARRGGLCCRGLPKEWATMADEDCEELEEDMDEKSGNDTPVIQTAPRLNLNI